MTTGGLAHADVGNRSKELDRPVRVLMSGISDQLLQETRKLDTENKIDFSFPSQNLSDFDLLIILVDEYPDAFEVNPFSQFGFESNVLPERGEYPSMVSVSVEFTGDDEPFPVHVIDRRFFFSRDRSCHPLLLMNFIIQLDWKSVVDNARAYTDASDCVQ